MGCPYHKGFGSGVGMPKTRDARITVKTAGLPFSREKVTSSPGRSSKARERRPGYEVGEKVLCRKNTGSVGW